MSIRQSTSQSKRLFVPTLLLIAAGGGCRLERDVSLLEQQYSVNRVEYTRAELKHLEQEFLREREHVGELERRIESMREREDILERESTDLESRLVSAEERLKALKGRAEKSATPAASGAVPDKELAELDVHLAALLAEAEKLLTEIEARRKAPPASASVK